MSKNKRNTSKNVTSAASDQLPLFEFDAELRSSEAAIKKAAAVEHSPFSKHIVYVDESGDHNLQSIDQSYPIFVLAFCVFHKRHYSEVIEKNSNLITLVTTKWCYMKMRFGDELGHLISSVAVSTNKPLWMS